MKYGPETISDRLIGLYVLCLPISWVSFSVGSVYRFFMILALGIYLFIYRGKFPLINKQNLFFRTWVCLFVYEAITIIWAVDKNASYNNILTLITTFSLVIICVGNITVKPEKLEKCWSIVGAIAALLFLFGTRTNVGYGTRQTLVLLGTSTDANEFAGLFVITLPFLLKNIISSGKAPFHRVLLGLLAISEFYVILMTGSRGALYAFLTSTVILLLYGKVTLRKLFFIVLIILLLMFVVLQFVIPRIPAATFSRFSLNTILQDKGTGRTDIWSQGFSNYFNGSVLHILLGYGTDGIRSYVFGKYTSTMHNTFLQILFDYGLVGITIFLTLLYKVFRKAQKLDVCYLSAFIGICIMSMTITMSFVYKPLWVFLITTSFLLPNHSNKEELKENIDDSISYNNRH